MEGRRKEIRIAAAVLLDDRGRMLVVRKHGTSHFMQPGGKIEPGETPIEALERELAEEVSLPLSAAAQPQGIFSAPAANEPETSVVAHIFSARVEQAPRIGREIDSMAWLDPSAPGEIVLAPLTRDHMLPLAIRLAANLAGELR